MIFSAKRTTSESRVPKRSANCLTLRRSVALIRREIACLRRSGIGCDDQTLALTLALLMLSRSNTGGGNEDGF